MSDTNANRMRTTHDRITGKRFAWNTTAEHHNPDGSTTIVPARQTQHGVQALHPRRVQLALLRELNTQENR